MRQVFVDTSAWDAIADGGDSNHELALLFREEAFAFDHHFQQMGIIRRP
jgi:predicted nucleic acid-binding protein